MSIGTSSRVYGGVAGDARAVERRAQLIEAAIALIGAEGAAAVTMRAVTRSANLSPRYFYESFANRSELMAAVVDQVVQRCTEDILAAVSAAASEPVEQARAAFLAFARSCQDDPRMARLLFRESQTDPDVRDRLKDAAPAAVLATSLTLADESWSAASTSPRVQFDTSALVGAIGNVYLDWTEGRLATTAEELADLCTELVTDMVRRRSPQQ